jgi:hypothetical protein
MGIDERTASPRALRAMTSMVHVRRRKKGNLGTVYVIRNFPTPTFSIEDEYPAMRASTLATLELVSTVPQTVSPL